ncbi:MAG: hypothetical protein ACKN9W_06970 [Methylococcus sp.]
MRTHHFMNIARIMLGLLFLVAAGVTRADGGGGPGGGSSGACRVSLGNYLVTFTAYQPQLTGTAPYCSEIPELGKSAIVFDFETKALRNLTVGFEITKEPGATRVFYQPPVVHATGTFTRDVNFTEAGDYTARMTLIQEGQTYNAQVPFSVAEAHAFSTSNLIIIATILVALGYFAYESSPAVKASVDRLLKKSA